MIQSQDSIAINTNVKCFDFVAFITLKKGKFLQEKTKNKIILFSRSPWKAINNMNITHNTSINEEHKNSFKKFKHSKLLYDAKSHLIIDSICIQLSKVE